MSTVSQRLELALIVFEPDTFFPKYLRSLEDVAEHRARLRMCCYSDFAVEHLITLLWNTIQRKRRKNLIYGLRALKWMLKNRREAAPIKSTTVDRLFELYQHFVFDRLDDIRWCVSAILKDTLLRPSQVRWLIEHQAESEHIVNRLLRYPRFDAAIADWARRMLRTRRLQERRSELLGRLIVDSLPRESHALPAATVLWAVYYSCAPLDVKCKLLEESAADSAADAVIEICLRLNLPMVLHRLRDRCSHQVCEP
jgi:hypothetical protein